MKIFVSLFFLCSLLFNALAVSAAETTEIDEAELLRAVEDYRFADLAAAIKTLENYFNNLQITFAYFNI